MAFLPSPILTDFGNSQNEVNDQNKVLWYSRDPGTWKTPNLLQSGMQSYTMMLWYCLVSSSVSLFAQLLSDKTESRHSLFCMHSSSLKNIFIQLLR